MELGLESNDTTILVKTEELITLEVDGFLKNLHLDRTRGIAVADTIRKISKIESDFVIGLHLIFHLLSFNHLLIVAPIYFWCNTKMNFFFDFIF